MLCLRNKKIYLDIEYVKTISTLEKCYIIIDKKVYDITEFLKTHPTGYDIILNKAKDGVDCKEDFYFHNKKAQKLIKKNYIGNIIS